VSTPQYQRYRRRAPEAAEVPLHSVCGASLRELFGGTLGGEVIYQRLLGRDSEDVLGAYKGLRWEGVWWTRRPSEKILRSRCHRQSVRRCWVMRQSISVLSNLNTWRTSHCGLPPGDRVADRNGCKRATRVHVGAGQPLRRAQGLHLGLQGGSPGAFLVPASWPKGALQQRVVPAVARFAF